MHSSHQWLRRGAFSLALAASIASCSVLAQEGDIDAPQEAPVLPTVQQDNGINYLTGGIGSGEAAAMRAEAAKYPLAVTFFAQGAVKGVYVSGVDVLIQDAKGNPLLHAITDGPFLLVRLAAGDYLMNVSYKGQDQHLHLRLRGDQHLAMNVRVQDADVAPTPAVAP